MKYNYIPDEFINKDNVYIYQVIDEYGNVIEPNKLQIGFSKDLIKYLDTHWSKNNRRDLEYDLNTEVKRFLFCYINHSTINALYESIFIQLRQRYGS